MANDFYVELFDRSYNVVPASSLKLTVQRYSGNAIGGYEQAEIAVDGPPPALWEALRWLRYYVVIRNRNQSRVWAGFVTQATINLGGLQVGKSLDEMANRVAVAYSYDDITGKSSRGTTAWADDTDSQAKYGTKELLQSEGDMELDQANQQRDKALELTNGISRPISLIEITPDGDAAPTGTLTLKGLWSTLSWQLYNQPGGVERYDTSGGFEHVLGWGLSSNTIAFESSQNRIHDLSGRFKELRKDDQVVVSGAATGGHNGTFSIVQAASIVDETAANTHVVYTHATIGFDPTDDISDNLAGLGFVQAYELIKVSGSAVAGNNRYYFAKSDLAPGHITVTPTTIATSIANPAVSVTIEQGHSMQLNASLGTEYPANTILIEALGKKIAQSFTLSVNLPFTVAEVYIRARVVGAPSDNFTIAIHADSAGSPGASLETISIVGSTVTSEMNWVKFTFSNVLTLNYGTTYHLVVSRSGSNTVTDFYMVDMNEDAEYTGGTMKLWNGSAWVARAWGDTAKTADMPFQVWGHQQTTDQINSILAAGGQFFDTIDIQDASVIASRQYRDQDQTAQVEVENLMKAGIYNSRRMVSSVTPERVVHVFQEPAYNVDTSPLLGDDGVLRDSSGGPWEPGRLPHGKWVTLSGIPTNVDEFTGISPVFIERAEYDCESDKFSALEPKGAPNPWDVVKLM